MAEPARDLRHSSRRCPTCGERLPGDYVCCPHDATPLGVGSDGGDPLVGSVLAGSYRITRLLARGGMGRLYEAEHTRLPRQLVVKVIQDHYADHPAAVARFEREARAAASVRSDHVLDVVDVVRSPDDRPCIVAEKLEGEDLQARLDRRGPLPLREAVRIARQLCRGLAAAHGAGVVHRDLKPSNVFVAANAHGESAKVLDFGVAKLAGAPQITLSGAVVGTPAYMAPEQARGAATVDERADVYGIGAVLYRMITGHAPFEAPDATSSLTRLMNESLVPARAFVPDLPEEVEDVLAAALASDPEDRPATALELERALRRIDPAADGLETDAPADADGAQPSLGASSAETTLVLPRGSVAGAALEARRLRRARPFLLAVLGALSLGAGLAVTAFLGTVVGAVRGATAVDGISWWLLLVAGTAATAGVASAAFQLARPVWTHAIRVRALHRRTLRAVGAGLVALGTTTLLARSLSFLVVSPLLGSPAEATAFALALAACAAAFIRQRA